MGCSAYQVADPLDLAFAGGAEKAKRLRFGVGIALRTQARHPPRQRAGEIRYRPGLRADYRRAGGRATVVATPMRPRKDDRTIVAEHGRRSPGETDTTDQWNFLRPRA